MTDSPLVVHVKRSIRRAILYRLEAKSLRKGGQQRLSEKLGLHQPDVSRLLAGKLDRFSTDVLLRTAETLGTEFVYDPKADAEAVREYTKLLAQCREAKSGTERETVNAVVEVLRSMKSPIIDRRLNHRQRLEVIVGDKRDTPREDLDWMKKQLKSLIAEMR